MTPGYLRPAGRVAPLSRVSPSRYLALAECELREVWSANKADFLLPVHPSARLGTAIHHILEKAGKGEFSSNGSAAIESTWNESVQAIETEMNSSWLERPLLPLSRSVKNFDVQKLRAVRKAREIASNSVLLKAQPRGTERSGTGCEIWVETPDKKVGGFVDHVFERDGTLAIEDYKSGLVLEQGSTNDVARPKTEYVMQLNMYAALYFCTFGRWPDRLQLVSTQGPPITIPLDQTASLGLVEDAKRKLHRINDVILHTESSPPEKVQGALARPSPSTCKNCLYRPNCEPFWVARESSIDTDDWPNDVRGEIKAQQTSTNGFISLIVHDGKNPRFIRAISPGARHPGLQASKVGDRIGCFNLRYEARNRQYQETAYTTIYHL